MPDAIFFDMDDTIILWETPVQTVWESAFRRFIKEAGGLAPADFLNAIHVSGKWYWGDRGRHRTGRLDLRKARREVSRLAFKDLGRTDFELADKIAEAYSTEREETGMPAPGAIDTLKDLRKRGKKLALITNGASDIQRAKIVKFNLTPLFDNILIEGEFVCGKPDERVFRHTLDRLNVAPESAWMVGDNLEYDIAPCRNLGIYSVWVKGNGDDSRPADGIRPDKTIRSISEIPDLI